MFCETTEGRINIACAFPILHHTPIALDRQNREICSMLPLLEVSREMERMTIVRLFEFICSTSKRYRTIILAGDR